jgi:hypothetical protein
VEEEEEEEERMSCIVTDEEERERKKKKEEKKLTKAGIQSLLSNLNILLGTLDIGLKAVPRRSSLVCTLQK